MLVHGSNLQQKESHPTKYNDALSKQLLAEIRVEYDKWHSANLNLKGPATTPANSDNDIVQKRTALFEHYKNFIDQQKYAEQFDSRSNLHSTVLEEFVYYLFRDLVADFGANALIGKSHTFKDIFFVPPNYAEMLKRPHARIEKKDHDFVIGTTVEASFQAGKPPANPSVPESSTNVVAESPGSYEAVAVSGSMETHLFDIPAVAIECKTYLDKTMLEGSSRAAEELKARNPNGLYIVVMEWIKLTEAVNLKKYKVDQIYVFRKQKNTDREYRFLESYVKNPVDPMVVWHLFESVRTHLTADWAGGVETGLARGWLLD